MIENENHNPQSTESHGTLQNGSESFRTVPHASEAFGNVPKGSEPFRKFPNDAESFRNIPKALERKENHTLTVREAARMFEAAGVARTERSIVNWCQSNRTGIARLDSYYDPNERRYYISPQSVELAIAEEKAKAAKNNDAETFEKVPQASETDRTVPNHEEKSGLSFPNDSETKEIKELESEIRDLQITNKAKDMYIEKIEKERDKLFGEAISANRKVGELESRLLQLEHHAENN